MFNMGYCDLAEPPEPDMTAIEEGLCPVCFAPLEEEDKYFACSNCAWWDSKRGGTGNE